MARVDEYILDRNKSKIKPDGEIQSNVIMVKICKKCGRRIEVTDADKFAAVLVPICPDCKSTE